MNYSSIPLDTNGKAQICPVCKNKDIQEGDFCRICGTHIVNRCSNASCNLLLKGDARYCPRCGAESTFFQNGLLPAWNDSASTETTAYDHVPSLEEKLALYGLDV